MKSDRYSALVFLTTTRNVGITPGRTGCVVCTAVLRAPVGRKLPHAGDGQNVNPSYDVTPAPLGVSHARCAQRRTGGLNHASSLG